MMGVSSEASESAAEGTREYAWGDFRDGLSQYVVKQEGWCFFCLKQLLGQTLRWTVGQTSVRCRLKKGASPQHTHGQAGPISTRGRFATAYSDEERSSP